MIFNNIPAAVSGGLELKTMDYTGTGSTETIELKKVPLILGFSIIPCDQLTWYNLKDLSIVQYWDTGGADAIFTKSSGTAKVSAVADIEKGKYFQIDRGVVTPIAKLILRATAGITVRLYYVEIE